jgi:signal transduction histidine kinase
LYRSLQEGLTNAFRHGKADRVLVHLQQAGDMIILNITDNGRGSGSSGISEGVGLAGMRERVESMGGTIHFRNLSGGFKLTVELPKDGLPCKSERKMVSAYD